MNSRLELQTLLESILGSRNVYYNPPATILMRYPAIVYSRSDIKNFFAGNTVYSQNHVYEVTVIDKDPDSLIVERVSKLPTVRFDRHFESDNLNHDVFKIFY